MKKCFVFRLFKKNHQDANTETCISGGAKTDQNQGEILSWRNAWRRFWTFLPYLFFFMLLVGLLLVFVFSGIWAVDRLDIAKRACECLSSYAGFLPWLVVVFTLGLILFTFSSRLIVSSASRMIKRISIRDGEIEFQDQVPGLDEKDMEALSDDIVSRLSEIMNKRMSRQCQPNGEANTDGKEGVSLEFGTVKDTKRDTRYQHAWEQYREIEFYALTKHGEDIGAELVGQNIRSPDGKFEFDGIYRKNNSIIVAEVKILHSLVQLQRILPSLVARFLKCRQSKMFRGNANVAFHVIISLLDRSSALEKLEHELLDFKSTYPFVDFFIIQKP